MSHRKSSQSFTPPVTERFGTPILRKDKDTPLIECPFCKPTHALSVSGPSACGTMLQLRAVQRVYKGRFNKGMVCIKCGKGGGELVHFNDAFVHANDCTPGVYAFADQPKFSRMAQMIFTAPGFIKRPFENRLGKTMAVEEVLPDGTKTGKHLGYFFYKKA